MLEDVKYLPDVACYFFIDRRLQLGLNFYTKKEERLKGDRMRAKALVILSLLFVGCTPIAPPGNNMPEKVEVSKPSLIGPPPLAIQVIEFYSGPEGSQEAVAFYANFLGFLEVEWREACATGVSISTACLYENRRISVSHNGSVAMVAIIPPVVTSETVLPLVAAADDVEQETPVFAAKRMAHETAGALGLLRPFLPFRR